MLQGQKQPSLSFTWPEACADTTAGILVSSFSELIQCLKLRPAVNGGGGGYRGIGTLYTPELSSDIALFGWQIRPTF